MHYKTCCNKTIRTNNWRNTKRCDSPLNQLIFTSGTNSGFLTDERLRKCKTCRFQQQSESKAFQHFRLPVISRPSKQYRSRHYDQGTRDPIDYRHHRDKSYVHLHNLNDDDDDDDDQVKVGAEETERRAAS